MLIKIPTNCPCCDFKLELVNDQLFCKNSSCSMQLSKKLEHFCKTMQIKGLGPKTLEKLAVNDITELYYLELEDIELALASKKLAQKVFQEIENSKHMDIATVLASFSIPLIGTTLAQKLSIHINNLDEISLEICKQAKLGDKATQNLLNWHQTEYVEIKNFLPFKFEAKPQQTTNTKTICITGKLQSFKTKQQAYTVLQNLGYKVVETVTKTLDYLVDEENKSSTKRKKAEQLGIEIIENLTEFIKRNKDD